MKFVYISDKMGKKTKKISLMVWPPIGRFLEGLYNLFDLYLQLYHSYTLLSSRKEEKSE